MEVLWKLINNSYHKCHVSVTLSCGQTNIRELFAISLVWLSILWSD